MKEKISEIFDAVQKLNVLSTENNVTLLSFILSSLREVYNEMEVKDGQTDSNE